MSGLLICDGRYATGREGQVIRRAFAEGGVLSPADRRHQLGTVFPIDSLRAADVALLRTGDREWYVVKDRHGRDGAVLGPEEVSELLAVQRRAELGLPAPVLGTDLAQDDAIADRAVSGGMDVYGVMGLAMRDPVAAGCLYLEEQIRSGRLIPDGGNITVHFCAVEISGTEVAPAADVTFPAVTGLPLPAPQGSGQRPGQRPLKHANDEYVRAENERLAKHGLTRQDVLRDGYNTKPRTDGGKA